MLAFRRSVVASSLVAALLGPGAAAHAAPTTWTIDPNHSSAGFAIRHLFTKVNGSFAKLSGTVTYDPQRPESSSVNAEIDASSVTTNNEARDKDLRSDDFFDVAKYPTITFASTKVARAGENKLEVEGTLTMHGVAKPVALDVDFLGSGKGMMGEDRAGFEGTTTLNRKDFNIVWNRNLDQGGTLLGDDVAIHLSIEAFVPPPAGQKKAGAPAAK
ncbi:MAG TPA: YceI family protein [Candidatus Eisenbacteria bacterium]